MKNKYTVIYNKRWQTGSVWHCLTKMARIELEYDSSNFLVKLEEMVDSNDIVYIFNGWPTMVGETEMDKLAS